MIAVTEFFEYWRTRFEKDLTPFADPGTRVDISGVTRAITARWTARGRSQESSIFSVVGRRCTGQLRRPVAHVLIFSGFARSR